MNETVARQLEASLPPDACVVDVGGGACPTARADWVIDALLYDQRGRLLGSKEHERNNRYTRETWVQLDVCDRRPWPLADKQFDFAICSHLLEDVRDPIWVCSEMSRIAKAGYIEIPSRVVEQSKGIEHPCFAGYYHHRWLVSINGGELEFRHKPHLLHSTAEAIVARVGIRRMINPRYQITSLLWYGHIRCREVLDFDEEQVVRELCAYSRRARQLPDLVVARELPWRARLRRSFYFGRLMVGRR